MAAHEDGARQEEAPAKQTAGVGGQQTLTRFFGGGKADDSDQLVQGVQKGQNKQNKIVVFKAKRHPMSLLKEGVSFIRQLPDLSQSIFTIIMPWRQEQEDEERKKQNKMKQTQARDKQQSLLSWVGKKGTEKSQGARTITKEEEKYQQQLYDGDLDENSDDFLKLQKVVKVKEVQKVRFQDYTQNAQAILINPKWRECDHFTKIVKLNSQSSSQGGEKKTTQDATPKDEDSDSDQESKNHSSKAFKGISMEEFSQLVIPKTVM
jgi:hypothetical protein